VRIKTIKNINEKSEHGNLKLARNCSDHRRTSSKRIYVVLVTVRTEADVTIQLKQKLKNKSFKELINVNAREIVSTHSAFSMSALLRMSSVRSVMRAES